MKQQLSKTERKTWIVVNITSIILIVFFFYLGQMIDTPVLFFAGGGTFLIITIISFVRVFINTGLWKMAHSNKNSLDERQVQVILNAMKYSYSIFTILIITIVYGFALVNKSPINVLVAACLLYIAHILPAAIIGWSEKYV
ncbi:MAG: hypothetical protein JXR31_07270 [Prolixibacteraceae bacterium]|nr:hypothetical protein [Prolixibacteraceae bacterium]MBN2774033.1 hypothetical protein [Prolixibacteraceae bacterium]